MCQQLIDNLRLKELVYSHVWIQLFSKVKIHALQFIQQLLLP